MALIDNTDITAEEIAVQGLESLDSKYQKTVGFFAWDFFVAIGKVLYDVWQKVIYIAKCLTDLSNMEEEDLKNFVFQTRGIEQKKASASSGYLTVTNGKGTIKAGDTFSTDDGTMFQATETVSVENGTKFRVECSEGGINGNVPANTITKIPTTIQGIVSVTNEEPFTNGYDAETKEDLLDRYYDSIRKPVVSGNIYHYEKWAKEVTGVGDAKVKSLWNGENTVKVVIIDSNKNVPSQELIDKVQNYIDPNEEGCGNGQAPIGAYCTVVGAEELKLDISLKVKLGNNQSLENITTEIKKHIEEYLKENVFDTNYVSYQKIGAIILSVSGVIDYSDLKINEQVNNITLIDNDEKTQIAVLGEVSISEIEEVKQADEVSDES